MGKKEQAIPQFIPSALNTPMLNYKVYIMNIKEKIGTFLLAFIAGGAVGLVFYGGQFRDSEGLATSATTISNIIIFSFVGLVVAKFYFPIRTKQLLDKRKQELTRQFQSFLEALAISLSSGMNMQDSLVSTYNDLKVEYADDAYMSREVQEMLNGLNNNITIEALLISLGERSEIDDIRNFGIVFSIAYRAGGNLKDIVRRTNDILNEKIEISAEIETAITSNKSQFLAMMCIPVILMVMMRTMSSAFAASFATIPGVIAVTIAIAMFAAAFNLGQRIMDIKG
ncbi:MAG: type II secretion system F family protein [Lachnospiraceae bacterium]|nr:type II secretion system F family protein [Lachnospiraceae bacterium]